MAFNTPGYRLYLKANGIQKYGPLLDGVKNAIAEHAGEDAAKMIVAGVAFELLKSIRKAVQKKGHISEGMWPFNC